MSELICSSQGLGHAAAMSGTSSCRNPALWMLLQHLPCRKCQCQTEKKSNGIDLDQEKLSCVPACSLSVSQGTFITQFYLCPGITYFFKGELAAGFHLEWQYWSSATFQLFRQSYPTSTSSSIFQTKKKEVIVIKMLFIKVLQELIFPNSPFPTIYYFAFGR